MYRLSQNPEKRVSRGTSVLSTVVYPCTPNALIGYRMEMNLG